MRSRAENDAHDQAYQNDRLGLLKLEAPGVEGGCPSNKYARPAKGKAYVSVEVNLFEKVGSRKELREIALLGDNAAGESTAHAFNSII